MPSPHAMSSGRENHFLLGAGGLVAGVASLAAVYQLTKAKPDEARQSVPPIAEAAPIPLEPGTADYLPVGFREEWTSRTIAFCADEVRLDRTLVIFSHGTCVLVHEPSENPLVEACAVLAAAAKPGAVFATATGADGAVMVTYRERVFQRFGKEDTGVVLTSLGDRYPELMTDGERAARDTAQLMPDAVKLGFVGRWCLLQDAAEKKPLRIVRERRNHTTAVR